MNKPNAENSMLIDIQYVKPNKKMGLPDYLYIIWKNLDTNEKFMQAVPEPMMDIYFEKPEYRDHDYNKNYQKMECLDKKTVKYKDIIYAIADDMGPEGVNRLQNIFNTHNYDELKKFYLYPYVYGADYDIRTWYRAKWIESFNNNRPKKLSKGFMDIEVDGFEVPGMPQPLTCPINAVSVIDAMNKTVYLFALINTPCREKNTANMSNAAKEKEYLRREMYAHMHKEQAELIENLDDFKKELHEMFDESYGEFEYKMYFYDNDERKMLVHLFQLINTLKMDMIGIWNISFDIPYIIDRLKALNMDPASVMCHPDFPSKECYFKKDTRNFDVKNKSDFFKLSSYTLFYDQMILYAAIRKGQKELRSTKLNYISKEELKDTKLDYSEDGDIKTLPYRNWKKFLAYNIKDTLLQYGIERKVTDFDTLYVGSYKNATPYENVFKQTLKLRSIQYMSFASQGLVPGENINAFNFTSNRVSSSEEEDDDDKYEGALVADPIYNDYTGVKLYGKPTNNIFNNAVDMDMSAFYPSSIEAMNIDPSTLIFKLIIALDQFDIIKGGKLPVRGITNQKLAEEYGDYPDAGKEIIDNFQTGNYLSMGYKWMNLPSVNDVYEMLKKELR